MWISFLAHFWCNRSDIKTPGSTASMLMIWSAVSLPHFSSHTAYEHLNTCGFVSHCFYHLCVFSAPGAHLCPSTMRSWWWTMCTRRGFPRLVQNKQIKHALMIFLAFHLRVLLFLIIGEKQEVFFFCAFPAHHPVKTLFVLYCGLPTLEYWFKWIKYIQAFSFCLIE